MKKVLSNNIATGVRQPYTQVTHEWYNDMITEASNALAQMCIGENSTDFIVLYGCNNSNAPNANISAGAIFYNGEIYLCPAFVDASITNAIVGTITTAYDSLDPVLFSDGNSFNVHQVKTIVWSDAASGSGSIDFADVVFQSGTVKRVIQIGDWNMDSTDSVTIPHGLDATKIISVNVTILRDIGGGSVLGIYPLNTPYVATTSDFPQHEGVYSTDATDVSLRRRIGGFFDNADFNSTSFNRGWIIIEMAL